MSAQIISATDYWTVGGLGVVDPGAPHAPAIQGGGVFVAFVGGAGVFFLLPANIKHKCNSHDILEANTFIVSTVFVLGMLTLESSSHLLEIPNDGYATFKSQNQIGCSALSQEDCNLKSIECWWMQTFHGLNSWKLGKD